MENSALEKCQAPSAVITSITFGISTEEEKEKLSVLAIDAVSEVTDPKLGLPNPSSQCSTCGAKDLKHCEGHFGCIKFPYTILDPYFLSKVVQMLNKICPGCKSIRKDLSAKGTSSKSREKAPKGCKYCVSSSRGWYPTMKFRVSSKEVFRRTAIIAEINEKSRNSQKRGPKKILSPDYWDIIPKDEQQDESDTKPNRRILSHAQVRHLLKDVDPHFIKQFVLEIDSIFMNCFPVTPNSHRVTEVAHAFSNGQRLIFDERTRAYKKLVDFRGVANELSFCVLDCLKASKINPDKSLHNEWVPVQQKKSNDFTCNSSGLRWMKDVVLGKRNDHSFRMVVVGDPNLKLSEIGMPRHVAERLQISEILTAWNCAKLMPCCELRILEKGDMHIRREGNLVRVRQTKELHFGDTIYRPLNDGDIVLINRPPSIHQHSLIALSVKILPVLSVLSINPLCCPPFHGDFDGDCMHGYVPQSVDTKVELIELLALDKQLANAQSGRNLLLLGQDSLVAAHLVMEDGVVLNRFEIQQLQMFCPRQLLLPAIVKAPLLDHGGVWTGKQLISMLLPEDFKHEFPSNGVLIRDGELISSGGSFWLRDTEGNLFQSLTKHCQGKFLDFLFAAQEVLCEWLSLRGLSVSLSDFYLCPDSYSWGNMMDEISCGLQDAEHTCIVRQLMVDSYQEFLAGSIEEDQFVMDINVERLCYEKQRSAALSQASVDAFKQVFRDIQSLVYKYADKDNALLAMFKAGSKGNLQKLVQQCFCLGLQHSLAPLSFRMPHQLSCGAWNKQKTDDAVEHAKHYIPSAVVQGSFLTGLNPLECFVHSVTTRDSSFGDNADLPGTLTRRLMFFMRDLHAEYDGTVRSAYGNQVVQFSYNSGEETSQPMSNNSMRTNNCDHLGGEPVGSLAACAFSEAAYSALHQPISLLEKSPLLNLKNVLECGLKKSNAYKSFSLFLSDKLGRHRHGFEYGALEVKNHLERVLFSDLVSVARIMFSPQHGNKTYYSPWVCHFHVYKEVVRKKGLKVNSIIDALCRQCETKTNLPNVQISNKDCLVADTQNELEETFCISVSIIESSKSSPIKLESVRDMMIPFLLQTVIKGFLAIKKVEILWTDKPKIAKPHTLHGELYLRVFLSGDSDKMRLWNLLVDNCLPIMDMIDWARSHPDNILDFCLAFGIDAGWKHFLNNLEAAVSDIGKTILPKHLILVANTLSFTGEFVGLNARGLKRQRELASLPSPFVQACFSNPGNCFIKAAKAGAKDDLLGTVDALAWGKVPPVGTGKFDIIYSAKNVEHSEPLDVYSFLDSQISLDKQNDFAVHSSQSSIPDKYCSLFESKFVSFKLQGLKKLEIQIFLRCYISSNDVQKFYHSLRKILNNYPIGHVLNETDKQTLLRALRFHPQGDEKIGIGAQDIKIINHPEHPGSRCFSLVREDGTTEDFSYHKCVHGFLEIIAPQKAKVYHEKFLLSRSK